MNNNQLYNQLSQADKNMDSDAMLFLGSQVCFPLYSAARLLVRAYTPILQDFGLTYPQYLVMLVMWEHGTQTVNEINEKLYLDNNTVTPLLKRMELSGLISRQTDPADKRKVIIAITKKGQAMKKKAREIPQRLMEQLSPELTERIDFASLKQDLELIMQALAPRDNKKGKE